MNLRVLFLGDIVGLPGRRLVEDRLPALREHLAVDLVIANVENVANGSGITRPHGEAILKAGVDVMTLGDHAYGKRDALNYVAKERRLVRPLNYPKGAIGRGTTFVDLPCGRTICVFQVQGRVFMGPSECPFLAADRAIETARARTPLIFCDVHAEATSEKVALGWHLDGRVTALVGTHTHVQTADETILPGGSAYLTDLGMTGPHDSVIGREKRPVLQKFMTNVPAFFGVAKADVRINGALVTACDQTGQALSIQRVRLTEEAAIETAAFGPIVKATNATQRKT